MERVLDLTLKLADEGLTPDEQGELERLIEAEPLARRRHLQMLEVEAALRTARHRSSERLLTAPSSSLLEELAHALRLKPDYADAKSNLEVARQEQQRRK